MQSLPEPKTVDCGVAMAALARVCSGLNGNKWVPSVIPHLSGYRPGAFVNGTDRYSVSLHATTATLIFPDFDRLPAPAAVIAMVQKTRPVAMVDITGKSIQLDAKTLSK